MNVLGYSTFNHCQNAEKESLGNSTSEPYNQESESNLPYYDNILNPQNQISCDLCRKNITSYTHMLCEEGDFCVTCFASLNPLPLAYHVIRHLNFPLIDQQWSALEELLLINAVERFGYGNWTDIKLQLGDQKTQQQIAEHYQKLLIISENNRQTLICTKNQQLKIQRISSKPEKNIVKSKTQLHIEQQKNKYNMSLQENKLKIVGHIPKRGDFQIQYDNDLELIISQMQFLESDTPQITQLKYKILDIFCERLNKRYQVKDFVVERSLLDLNELNRKQRKRSKQEKETSALLQPFLRYMSTVDQENLIIGITKENHLKQQISTEKEFKQKDIKNYSQSEDQSNLSKKRSISTKKKMNSKHNRSKFPFITEEEFALCKKLQISQLSYVLIKSTMKCQYLRNQHLQISYFYNISKLKPIFINEIHRFLKQKSQLR